MYQHYRQTWDELHHRRRTLVILTALSALFFFFFFGLAVGWVFALLVPSFYLFWLGRYLNRADAPLVSADPGSTGSVASTTTTATVGPAMLAKDDEQVEVRTTIVGRGMTREQMCAFINQRIADHKFIQVSADIKTYSDQSEGLLYTVILDGHVKPPERKDVSSPG